MGWDGTGCDGMRRNRTEQDGVGWDGMVGRDGTRRDGDEAVTRRDQIGWWPAA